MRVLKKREYEVKHTIIICAFMLVASLSGCPSNDTPSPGAVGMSMILHKNSNPDGSGYADSFNLMASKGVNLFGVTAKWSELETSPNAYALGDLLVNPIRIVDSDFPNYTNFVVVLKTLNTYQRDFPLDLANAPFDGDEVIVRFESLVDAIAKQRAMRKVSHILVGNEVDVYLSANREELNAYAVFLQSAVERIHQEMPWMKVGTVFTYNLLALVPQVFDTLAPHCDFVAYTYYPTDSMDETFQMRPPENAAADINLMASKAGQLPFAFTEIGYAASPTTGSSEERQKQFVEHAFDALKPYKTLGNLEFLVYHGLYDFPTEFCSQYAQQQGIDDTHLCEFMNSLGLQSYETGQPRLAWDAFVAKMEDW